MMKLLSTKVWIHNKIYYMAKSCTVIGCRSGQDGAKKKRKISLNPLLTKLVRSRWLDIGPFLFLRVYGPQLRLGP